jgi:hypothetical protein
LGAIMLTPLDLDTGSAHLSSNTVCDRN